MGLGLPLATTPRVLQRHSTERRPSAQHGTATGTREHDGNTKGYHHTHTRKCTRVRRTVYLLSKWSNMASSSRQRQRERLTCHVDARSSGSTGGIARPILHAHNTTIAALTVAQQPNQRRHYNFTCTAPAQPVDHLCFAGSRPAMKRTSNNGDNVTPGQPVQSSPVDAASLGYA